MWRHRWVSGAIHGSLAPYTGCAARRTRATGPPASVSELDPHGIPVLTLRALLTLKLASAMTAPHRPRDLDDVIQLIRKNDLDRGYAEQLDSYVRRKYLELWEAAQVRDEY